MFRLANPHCLPQFPQQLPPLPCVSKQTHSSTAPLKKRVRINFVNFKKSVSSRNVPINSARKRNPRRSYDLRSARLQRQRPGVSGGVPPVGQTGRPMAGVHRAGHRPETSTQCSGRGGGGCGIPKAATLFGPLCRGRHHQYDQLPGAVLLPELVRGFGFWIPSGFDIYFF